MLPSTSLQRYYKMIDFIDIVKPISIGKITPNFGYCKMDATYANGTTRFVLDGCERLYVYWNEHSQLRLCGSIMYYLQGHNFSYNNRDFCSAINYLGKLLNVVWWDAYVNQFEYGVIMQVDDAPKDYIKNHKAKPSDSLNLSFNEKNKGNFSMWTDKYVRLKMYDAGRNILMKQCLSRRQGIQKNGWNQQLYYLKLEVHYKKPGVLLLNEGQAVRLADLVDPNWQHKLKEDLFNQYKRLDPMSTIIEPTNKANLSTADLFALVLAEGCINNSQSIRDVKQMLYDKINAIPDDVLSNYDKKYRKRKAKAILDNLQKADASKWDLSQKLADILNEEPG